MVDKLSLLLPFEVQIWNGHSGINLWAILSRSCENANLQMVVKPYCANFARKIWSSPPSMCKGINQIVHGLELFNSPFKILKEVPALHFMTMFLYFVSCLVPHFTYRGCLTHYLLNLPFLFDLWRPLKWRKVNIQLTLTHTRVWLRLEKKSAHSTKGEVLNTDQP